MNISFNRGFGRRCNGLCPYFRRALATMALCLLLAAPASAIQPVQPGQNTYESKLSRPFIAPELDVQADLEPSVKLGVGRYVPMKAGAAEFLQREGGEWELRWDRRSDRPNLVQGSGIALVPGSGNTLSAASLGLAAGQAVDLAILEMRLRDFIAANADFLQTQNLEFHLDAGASTPYGDGSTHWFVEFAQYANGVRVDRANLFFRLSHGNIVQFGGNRVAPVAIDTRPSIDRAAAFKAAWDELAFPAGTYLTETVEAGELRVLPVLPYGGLVAEPYMGPNGAGYAHRLAWRFVFRVNDDDATYEVLFDAHTKAIIEVRNLVVNADAHVTAGIYPTTNTDPEIVVPMPFVSVTNGGTKITDVLGMYDYSGGTATTSLGGKYFKMSDNCGSISLSNSTDGNLDLGTSGGTDCTTPGVGGNGNTHASRTGFYHLTNINRKAATFFPSNSWLASTVTANMNVNQTCNASWNGSTLNFYKSGGGCSNTGEIAAVFLHEWGHGMDTNTGGAASENGSGEAVGDTFAFLETKDACIGKNFKPGVPCYNCDTTCTGVRDVEAFSTRGAATIAKPSTITSTSGAACARWSCPYLQQGVFPYQGPMGYEGHCESYIASSANWDLSQALVDQQGQTGWHAMDRIWYGSLVPSKSAYQVVSGGKCNVNAVVNGCGSNNWYTVLLAADDDDGNLANGTPNACRIWDAFDAHGIACGTRPACSGPSSYTVGGTVSGLAGNGLTLKLNGGGDLAVTANGVFTFAGSLPPGSAYQVTIGTQPSNPAQTCSVANDSGTIGAANVTDVAVACTSAPSYGVGGNVSGLAGSGLILQLNGGNDLTIASNGAFVFPTALPGGSAYTVTVSAHPSDPAQTCSVDNASGTVGAANVTNIAVTCTTSTYTVGGSVSGLAGSGLVLSLNGSNDLPIGANGSFTFPGALASGTAYAVSVGTQPSNPEQTCTVGNASGTVGAANISDIEVACSTNTYTVGGTVSGLTGSGLKLKLNSGANLAVASDGAFAFATPMSNGDSYTVSVSAQPSGPPQTCVVSNGSGAIAGANVTDVLVTCGSAPTYTVGGTVGGLIGSGLTLQLNDGAKLAIGANGAFTFPDALLGGAPYAVTVGTQPMAPAQTCSVANGSGTVGATNVTNIAVDCATDIGDRIFVNGFEGGSR